MVVRLMLLLLVLCGQGELLASGVRVLIKRMPVERLVQKFTLKDFPAQTLTREVELVPSAAAFIDELLQVSCQSCFDKIFDKKNFEQYYLITDQTEVDGDYISAYADKLWLNHNAIYSKSVPYDVTVSYTDEATLAASLLAKFDELDEFYQAIRTAQQQLDADMPVAGVRREVFIAQREQYSELYQHTRAEVDAVLTDLRALLDEHGREYPHDILASVDTLEAHLRSLIEARDTWLQNIDATVEANVTPHMEELRKRARDLFRERREKIDRQQKELERQQKERDRQHKELDRHSYTHDLFQNNQDPVVDHHNYYLEQQKQHQDTMTAIVAIDPFDIF